MDNQEKIKALFHKFIEGYCTSEEIAEIIQYLKASDNESALPEVEEVKTRLRQLPALDEQSSEKILNKILREGKSLPLPSGRRINQFSWSRVAAAVTGFLLVVGVGYQLFYADATIKYVTDFGETQTIQLPDGSEVMLNANSQLSMEKGWSTSKIREVWLSGEAFFTVTHTPDDQQFVVHTSQDFSVEVLGTEFNVNDRGERTRVVLNTGKVKVRAQKDTDVKELLMKPGDMVEYEQDKQQLTQKTVDPNLYTSWRNNLLLFKDASLREVAQIIKDNFGYQVKFADAEVAGLHFTGSNPADDLELLLNTLSKSFNLEITKDKKVIHMAHKKRNPPAEGSISIKQVGEYNVNSKLVKL